MTIGRKDNKGKRVLITWGIIALVVFSVFLTVFAKVVIAEVRSQKDTSRVYAQARAKEKYVYDPDQGKWVKESTLTASDPQKEEDTSEEDLKKAQISEYLEMARKSFAIYDFYEAGQHIGSVLEIDENNAEALALRDKIDKAVLEYESEISTISPEEMAKEKDVIAEAEEELRRLETEKEAKLQAEEEAYRLVLEREAQLEEEELRSGEAEKEAQIKAEEEARKIALEREAQLKAEEEQRIAEEAKLKEEEIRRLALEIESQMTSQKQTTAVDETIEDLAQEREAVEIRAEYLAQSRNYAEQALVTGDDSPEAKELLASIEKSERALQQELERISQREEALRSAEEEVRRKAEEARQLQERSEKIAGYLDEAERYLNSEDYSTARSYAEKASQVDPDYETVGQMLAKIDEAQKAYEAEIEKRRQELEAERQAEEEAKRVAEETRQAEARAKKIASYLRDAEKYLDKEKYDRARSYAEKANKVEPGNETVTQMLNKIDEAQKSYEAEIEKMQQELEDARKAEEEKIIAQRVAEEKSEYLVQARKYAQQAVAAGDDSPETRELLATIEKAERARQAELDRIIQQEEELRQAEEEAKRVAEETRQAEARAKKIASYLRDAEKYLDKEKYDRARSYAEKANKVEPGNETVTQMLNKIDEAQKAYEAEIEKRRQELEAERQAEEEAKRVAEETRQAEARAKKIASYLRDAEKYLDKEKYDRARSYAEKANKVEPGNEMVSQMLTKIDETEKAEYEELERLIREQEAQLQQEEQMKQARELADEKAAYLEQARKFAQKAVDTGDDSQETRELLESLDKAEKARQEELERIRLEKEAKEKADEEARLKAEEEQAMLSKAEMMAKYLEDAENSLAIGNFDQARSLAQKALEVDPNNVSSQEMFDRIDKAESSEIESFDQEKREKYQGEIQNYLEQSRKSLEKDDFKGARKYAKKVLKKEKNHTEALQLLSEIDRQESVYSEDKGLGKYGQRTPGQAKDAVIAYEKMEAQRKRQDEKVRKDIHKARQYLAEGKYEKARKYAYEAWKQIPHDTEVAVLLADINKTELFGPTAVKEDADLGMGKKLAIQKKEDPLYKYDEGKSWTGYVSEIFKKKTYELGEIEHDKAYDMDECVKIALRTSQRTRVADEQVKLAEMRVWERRRDLLPELAFKREWSSGKITSGNFNRHYKGQKYKFELKHDIFDGFKVWYEIRQTQANLDIVKLERDKVVNEIVAQTQKAYYNLDKAIKSTDVQAMIKERINNLYDIVGKAFEQELVPHVEYLKVKAENMQIDYQYMSSEEDISLAEMILFQAMNMDPPDHHINIVPVKAPERITVIGLENCYKLALANSPDLRIKERTIEYYDFERKMKKSAGWPKVEFNTSIGESYERFEPLNVVGDNTTVAESFNPMSSRTWEREWYAGIKTSMPFWGNTVEHNYVREFWAPTVSSFRGSESATNYFTVKMLDDVSYFSNLQESRVGFERSKHEYIKAKKDLLVKVKETYFQYRKALLNREVSMAQVKHKKMLVDVLQERQKFGEMELSRIAQEYREMGEYQYGVWQGDADYFISISELNEAIGVPDYFDPWQEDKDYTEWKQSQGDEIALGGEEEQIYSTGASINKETDKRDALIAEHLAMAREELANNAFSQARHNTIEALELNGNNMEARSLLSDIDSAESEYRQKSDK